MENQNVNPISQENAENLQKKCASEKMFVASDQPLSSPEIGELAAALAIAQSQMTFAQKDSEASMGAGRIRTYADLASVINAVRKPLTDNGIAFLQTPLRCSRGLLLQTKLIHKSGQWIASEMFTPLDSQRTMNGIQALGSAMTYLRRYALAAICGIAQDDDDGESAGEIVGNSQQQIPAKNAQPVHTVQAAKTIPAAQQNPAAWFDNAFKQPLMTETQKEKLAELKNGYYGGDRQLFTRDVAAILRHNFQWSTLTKSDAAKIITTIEREIAAQPDSRTDPEVPDQIDEQSDLAEVN